MGTQTTEDMDTVRRGKDISIYTTLGLGVCVIIFVDPFSLAMNINRSHVEGKRIIRKPIIE